MTADIATLRQLLAEGTYLPWRTFPDAEGGVWGREGYGMAATGCGQGNADLIVAAVNALPGLLDRLEAAEGAVERVLELADGWTALTEGYVDPSDGPIAYAGALKRCAALIRAALDATGHEGGE